MNQVSVVAPKTPSIPHQPIWTTQRVPKNFWKNQNNQKAFLDWAASKLNIESQSKWYEVKATDLESIGGGGLLSLYKGSLPRALMGIYKDTVWHPWKFSKNPRNMHSVEYHKSVFEWVAKQLNLQNYDDWYRVTSRDLVNLGVYNIVDHYYNDNLSNLLQQIYPDHNWQVWRFQKVPKGFWNSLENQRIFMNWVAKELNVISPQDWYKISSQDVAKVGGSTLLNEYYDNSLIAALQTIYPEFKFLVWRFSKIPRNFWNSDDHIMEYMTWLSDQLGIKMLNDWYLVSRDQIAGSLVGKIGGLLQLLQKCYPEYSWDFAKSRFQSKSQQLLFRKVSALFPGEEIVLDFRKKIDQLIGSKHEIQYDVYIPDLKLAFEYQGDHHYLWSSFYGSPEGQQERDRQKREISEKHMGVTLIEVPFWWDRKVTSLKATINQARTELLKDTRRGTPIPLEIPPKIRERSERVRKGLLKDPYNITKSSYYVTFGKPGMPPKCRGCKKSIQNTATPRIETRGAFTPPNQTLPFPAKFAFCLNASCVRKGIEHYSMHPSFGVYLPPFGNLVEITDSVKNKISDSSLLENLEKEGTQVSLVNSPTIT